VHWFEPIEAGMRLEPQVIERIQRERSKARRQRILLKAPLLAAIAACVVLIVLRLTLWSETAEGLHGLSLTLLWITISLFAILLVAFTAWFTRMRLYIKRIAGRMTTPAEGMTAAAEGKARLALKTFRDALDAVAIGAGIPAPGLLVAGIPTVNALPVFFQGGPHAAVTAESLQADLSYREAEAMMSQVLSRVMLEHVWGMPVILRSGLVPFFLLGVLAFVLIITLLLFIPADAAYVVIAVLASLALLWSLKPAGRYMFKHEDIAGAHADALADSIAVKLTGDPAGMKALLEKLVAAMGEVEYSMELQYVSRYLFLCPTRAVEGESGSARGYAFRKVLAKTLAYANMALQVRTENLAMIEQGSWPTLESRLRGHARKSASQRS
jgi:protein-S-isoprenylcysteine O-methyltransferase Ste14